MQRDQYFSGQNSIKMHIGVSWDDRNELFWFEIRCKSVLPSSHIYIDICVSKVIDSYVSKRKRGRSREKGDQRDVDVSKMMIVETREGGLVISFGEYEERVRNERLMVWWNINKRCRECGPLNCAWPSPCPHLHTSPSSRFF